jgi:protein-S-isoprenylcysteine O-methyltransferase Ste14
VDERRVARHSGRLVTSTVAYFLLLAVLLVRLRTEDAPPPEPARPLPGEPLWLTRLHHALFALLLAGSPLERLLLGGVASWRATGLLCFAAGVLLYRAAGRTLGDALSPFIEPREGAPLVTHGVYRHLRHPIYLAQALIAVGAPLTLGCRGILALSAAALAILLARIVREEDALARTFPEYRRYAAKTKRLLPFVY